MVTISHKEAFYWLMKWLKQTKKIQYVYKYWKYNIQDVQDTHLSQKILLDEFKCLHAQSGILNN